MSDVKRTASQAWQEGPNAIWVHYDDYATLEAKLKDAEAENARLKEGPKPKCPDCNAVGLGHCSDPENCGRVYWPDYMYRSLEQQLREAQETIAQLTETLRAASHALRSYQYGNSSEELAEEMADKIDAVIAARAKEPR